MCNKLHIFTVHSLINFIFLYIHETITIIKLLNISIITESFNEVFYKISDRYSR